MQATRQDYMQAWVSLIHAASHLRAGLEEALREQLGIGLAEQDLLKQLSVNGGQLTLTELSTRIYFSKAGITKMLDRLEKAGLVLRQPMPGDRRSLSATLTEEGRVVFTKSRALLGAYVKSVLYDRLSDQDIVDLKNILERLLSEHGVFEGQQRHLRGEA